MSRANSMRWAMAAASITALVACGSSDSGGGGGGSGGAAGTGGAGAAAGAGGDTDGGTADAPSESGAAGCHAYCDCMNAACPGVLAGDCMTLCAGLSADAIECRHTHCLNAFNGSPAEHCPHAAGQAICQ